MNKNTRRIRITRIGFSHVPTKTRFPFKYGIAAMTEAPHVFVHSEIEVDGKSVQGISSEGLPPKWFTKDPKTTFEQDLPLLLEVIQHAADLACEEAETETFFEFWQRLYRGQKEWAVAKEIPGLLSNLGTSMIERSVLDAFCRGVGHPLWKVLRENLLGIDLGEIHKELAGTQVSDVLAPEPFASVKARHTVGLADPLRDEDVPADEVIKDGLPQSLEACIDRYGLTHFKIKLCGKLDVDTPRLRALSELITSKCQKFALTVDGNEQFEDIETFREHWEVYNADPIIGEFLNSLLLVEQPLHRDEALGDRVGEELNAWNEAPPMIIDESDADLDSLPRALKLGYRGTSHKNCKGIIKGLANAALLSKREGSILSGEDLANIGPVALLQDLAMMAALGVEHVERNGHHYFKGLSMFPDAIQQQVLEHHDDLYGDTLPFPSLKIEDGEIEVASLNDAPFGIAQVPEFDGNPVSQKLAELV